MGSRLPTVLVTGGGAGIGEAACRLFATRDWHAIIADHASDAGRAVAASLPADCATFIHSTDVRTPYTCLRASGAFAVR